MWRESKKNKAGRLIRSIKPLGIDLGRIGKCIGELGDNCLLTPLVIG